MYRAGEALTVPAGVVHAVRNVGTSNASGLATYVVEKGKPLLTVAAQGPATGSENLFEALDRPENPTTPQ